MLCVTDNNVCTHRKHRKLQKKVALIQFDTKSTDQHVKGCILYRITNSLPAGVRRVCDGIYCTVLVHCGIRNQRPLIKVDSRASFPKKLAFLS